MSSIWGTCQAEEFFETAHTVYDAFRNGDLQAKKRIVRLVGGNSILKDGILTWEYNKPFSFLVDRNKVEELEPLTVGTLEFCFVDKEKSSPFGELDSWRGVVDEVGMYFRAGQHSIFML